MGIPHGAGHNDREARRAATRRPGPPRPPAPKRQPPSVKKPLVWRRPNVQAPCLISLHHRTRTWGAFLRGKGELLHGI
eukprot:54924-Chlamydomonas_euryale.AAC.4